MHKVAWVCSLSFLLAGSVASADISDEPGTETHRYVVDQRDGSRVPGAIVVATWYGRGGLHQGSSCNRIESYISDADGGFTTPNDRKSGFVLMIAYKKGYEPGRPPRMAQRGVDGNFDHWQVLRYRRNVDNTSGEVESVEPTIYLSETAAQLASRQFIDVYVQKTSTVAVARLEKLHSMRVAASCGGLTLSTPGAKRYFQALYDEQVDLGDQPGELAFTNQYIDMARPGK